MKTLRTRIITGYVVIIVVLITGGIITAKTQRDHLFGAVDARIARVIDSPRFIEKRIESGRPGKPAGAGLSDMYLGLVAHDAGGLSTLSAPDDDPAFERRAVRIVQAHGMRDAAFQRSRRGGDARRRRVLISACAGIRATKPCCSRTPPRSSRASTARG